MVVAGWWVIGGRNGGDRCVLPRVWEEQQEPRVSLPIPKLWDRLGLTRAGVEGEAAGPGGVRLVSGCDRCAPAQIAKGPLASTSLPPTIRGPTFSPKVNWETQFVRQCRDVQEPECGDSLVAGLWHALPTSLIPP